MSEITYAIVFSGQVLDGHQMFSVKAHMSKMLKADANKMATLFSGKQVVLKRTPDKDQAIKIGTALKKVGADVKIRAIKTEAKPAQDAEPGGLSLLPNEGYIVQPKPEPPPLDLDLSGITLAENDDTPLSTPKQESARADIDLSEYSVSENDGSPLVEPSNKDVPEVDAPDFGLDEPGAVLDTIKEEKVLLNPDVSGISLAEAGADLIDDKDRAPAPPPKAPDVSRLELVDA